MTPEETAAGLERYNARHSTPLTAEEYADLDRYWAQKGHNLFISEDGQITVALRCAADCPYEHTETGRHTGELRERHKAAFVERERG